MVYKMSSLWKSSLQQVNKPSELHFAGPLIITLESRTNLLFVASRARSQQHTPLKTRLIETELDQSCCLCLLHLLGAWKCWHYRNIRKKETPQVSGYLPGRGNSSYQKPSMASIPQPLLPSWVDEVIEWFGIESFSSCESWQQWKERKKLILKNHPSKPWFPAVKNLSPAPLHSL